MLTYHAYDQQKDLTFLIANDKSLFNFPGSEKKYSLGSAFAKFSLDGKHFVYKKQLPAKGLEVYFDGKKISQIKGTGFFEFNLDKSVSDVLIDILVPNPKTTVYHEDNEWIYFLNDKKITEKKYQELTNFQPEWDAFEKYSALIGIGSGLHMLNGVFGVYLDDNNNALYAVRSGFSSFVSLSGNDAGETFDEIFNLRFSPDKKSVQFEARKGLDLYSVLYPIVN